MIIKNKLRDDSLRNYALVDLKVNDMHIKAKRLEGGKWKVIIFHEEKNTNSSKVYTTAELIDYLNAYITTARTQIKFNKEE